MKERWLRERVREKARESACGETERAPERENCGGEEKLLLPTQDEECRT